MFASILDTEDSHCRTAGGEEGGRGRLTTTTNSSHELSQILDLDSDSD